jgi:hypothetical protein
MSELAQDHPLLGAYVLGVADDEETRAIHEHLMSCARCRNEFAELAQMRNLLGEVPPEAFLDGPPEGGDLLLRRTLRRAREESSPSSRPSPARNWPRLVTVAASVVALAAVTLGAGVLIGERSAPRVVVQGPPSVTTAPATPPTSAPAGTRTVTGVDQKTGTRMTATVIPAAGWVRLRATVEGVPAGKRCELRVVSQNGTSRSAGSWLVSAKGEKEGTTLDGSALVALTDVASIEVVTLEGERLITVPV